MTLGEFIREFSHNNVIRLVYKIPGGHEPVFGDWNDVSMDHEVNRQKGKFRHFVNNKVLGLASILLLDTNFSESINIEIEKLEKQPFLEEAIEDTSNFGHSMSNHFS